MVVSTSEPLESQHLRGPNRHGRSQRLRLKLGFHVFLLLGLLSTLQHCQVVQADSSEDSLPLTDGPDKALSKTQYTTNPPIPSVSSTAPSPEEQDHDSIIIVVTVDGTIAGISKDSGKVVWKQQTNQTANSPKQRSPGHVSMSQEKHGAPEADVSLERILKPIVSTTTTTRSASSSEFAAVPSLDGLVYLTSHSGSDSSKDSSVTISTSVKELAQRSPFVDPKGRIYSGRRLATVAALDKQTGEILTVVSAGSGDNDSVSEAVSLEGRSVLWIGRVEHTVAVQNAKSGSIDAEFSFTEVLSLGDMREGSHFLEQMSFRGTPMLAGRSEEDFDPILSEEDLPGMRNSQASKLSNSRLVSTPSGNLAFAHSDVSRLKWVADTQFDTPIAYALDASSGQGIDIDFIPDVTRPSSKDLEYLSREMERQLHISGDQGTDARSADAYDDPQTIIGRLRSNGQLYALPLGKNTHRSSSTFAGAAAALQGSRDHPSGHSISTPRQNALSTHTSSRGNVYHSDTDSRLCNPTSPRFPSCLSESRQKDSSFEYIVSHGEYPYLSRPPHTSGRNNELAIFSGKRIPLPPNGNEELEYIYLQEPPYLLQLPWGNKPRRSGLSRLQGSWLLAIILCMFVLSFELGRRKKQKEEQKASMEDLVDGNSLALNEVVQEERHVIQVSDEVLGYGGQGTVVYKGMLDGRAVAVKRMLKAYHASADREIGLLIESDGHPNVVRYFLKELRGDFVYLALELCDMSLHDMIGVLRDVPTPIPREATRQVLLQVASGVKHLHSLRIVHRDLKPANVLLALKGRGKAKADSENPIFENFSNGCYVAKISDMGLGKQIVGQSSFGGSTYGNPSGRGTMGTASSIGVGPGSVGWQAPEAMAVRWAASDQSLRSENEHSKGSRDEPASDTALQSTRLSRSVDIFSLGCIFHSILVPGQHPFGEWFEREANIMRNCPSLSTLCDLSFDAFDLVRSMLNSDPKKRPTARQICDHPFFWSAQLRLSFLCEFSDRLETETDSTGFPLAATLTVEQGASDVVGASWDSKLDDSLISNMRQYRTYDPSSVRDLLRLIRNKYHHFDELPEEFRASHVEDQDALYGYFEARFPRLLMHCFGCCQNLLTDTDPLMQKYSIPANNNSRMHHLSSSSSIFGTGIPTEAEGQINADEECEEVEQLCNGGTGTELKDTSAHPYEQPVTSNISPEPPPSNAVAADLGNIVPWEGSTAAKILNCRGWSRSEEEWTTRIDPCFLKKDPNLKRCSTDGKFRTRLCNHWDNSMGTFCPMRKKNKCIFAHGPAELRVKEGKRNRWGRLVDKNGDNSNPWHSGGEDTFGAATSIESVRKEEGKWNTENKTPMKGRKNQAPNRRKVTNGGIS